MAVANNHGGAHDTANSTEVVPFWNVNIPKLRWTAECPSYLQYAFENDKDRGILSTPDSHYNRQTWPQVKQIVCENRLADFDRVPSELRLYREFCSRLIHDHGSIMSFILSHRLHWSGLTPSGAPPFTNPPDYKILYNDWPYGIDERIVHLIVWMKFHLPADPHSEVGDMAPETREAVDAFVGRTFGETCGRENVIWFKNWAALKSVHAVEHVHVMLFDADPGFVEEVTGGDVPLFKRVKESKPNDGVEVGDVQGR